MKELFEDPPRWREHRDQNNVAERTIGQDLRAIRTPAILSGAQMARIAARIRPSRPRYSRPWLVVAAALVLGVATAAFATHLHLLPRWLTGASAPPSEDGSKHRAGRKKPRSGAVAPAPPSPPAGNDVNARPTVESPSLTQPPRDAPSVPDAVLGRSPRHGSGAEPSAGRPARPDRRTDGEPVSPSEVVVSMAAVARPQEAIHKQPHMPSTAVLPPPPVLAAPSAPAFRPAQVAMLAPPRSPSSAPVQDFPKPAADADASRLLADAIRLLRADRQPQAALASLDHHATRLEHSPYRHEALLIRVEALLALKRDGDLLRLLDGMPLANVAASRTLLVTRGRLRAAAKRCAEAVVDFDHVLAEAGHKDAQALLGRALCREAMGDLAGAKADRERYRQESSAPSEAATNPASPP